MELLVLFPLVGFILFWQRWQSTTVATAALHTLAALILLLFLAGLTGWLPGMRMLILGLGTALLAFELVRHRERHLGSLGSVPLIMLLAMCVVFFAVHGSTGFRYYDEFSHWGIYLREMLAIGGFWGADTNSLHVRYPPGPALWQYLFVSGETPREGAAYFAQFLLLVIPLLVLFQSLQWKQVGWIAGIVVLILFGFGNYGHGIASIYADHVLAAWLAGLFLNFMSEPRERGILAMASYAVPLTALALFKNAGLFFALALPFLFVALLLLRSRGRSLISDKRLAATFLLVVAAWFAGPLLATSAWSYNRDALGTTQGALSAPGIVGIVTGKVKLKDAQRAQTINPMFKDVFLNQQLSKNKISDRFNEFSYGMMPMFQERFKLTTATFLILFVVWSALMIRVIVPGPMRPAWALGFTGMLGIALAYIVILYLSYLFFRNEMVSYVRYVHSVILALLFAGLAPLLPVFASADDSLSVTGDKAIRSKAAAIFAFAVLALMLAEKPHYQSIVRPVDTPLTAFRADIKPITQTVRATVGRARLWAYLPDPNPHNLTSRIVLYEMSPTPTEINRDFGFFDRPREEILADWAGYDYVWIVLQHDELDQKLRTVVGPDLGQRLYRVETTADRVRVRPVETVASPPG